MRTILLSLLLLSAASTAAETFSYGGVSYSADERGCAVTRPTEGSYSGSIVIPSEVEYGGVRHTVTTIADSAFAGSRVEELTLPATLRRIGTGAFTGCSHLNKLHIADIRSWCAIEFAAPSSSPFAAHFYGSQQLWVGDTPTDSIAIECTDVPADAFNGWECIRKLTVGNGVASIGSRAFNECTYLNTVRFGKDLRRIDANAFGVCEWLRRVEVPSLSVWCAIEFATASSCPLSNSRVETFIAGGEAVTDLVIGDDCPAIGQYAFHQAPMITSVTLGDGVTAMGRQAFFGCANLRNVNLGNGLTAIPLGAFMQCKAIGAVDFGESVEEIGESAFSNCESLATLSLPRSLRSIGQTSFAFLQSMVSLTVPSGVESLGQGCFSWCTSLEEVDLPSSLKKVGFAAFAFCDKLSKIDTGNTDAPEAPSTNPPFSSKAYAAATLNVPRGSADSYRSAPGWKNFTNIVEAGTSSAPAIGSDETSVTASGGVLTINTHDGTEWTVADLDGRIIAHGSENAVLSPSARIVIASVGGKSYKLVLR